MKMKVCKKHNRKMETSIFSDNVPHWYCKYCSKYFNFSKTEKYMFDLGLNLGLEKGRKDFRLQIKNLIG